MLKITKNIIFLIFFPFIPMGALRYRCLVRLVPTYILPPKYIRLLGKFQPDSFKTERDLYTTCKRSKTFGKVSAR